MRLSTAVDWTAPIGIRVNEDRVSHRSKARIREQHYLGPAQLHRTHTVLARPRDNRQLHHAPVPYTGNSHSRLKSGWRLVLCTYIMLILARAHQKTHKHAPCAYPQLRWLFIPPVTVTSHKPLEPRSLVHPTSLSLSSTLQYPSAFSWCSMHAPRHPCALPACSSPVDHCPPRSSPLWCTIDHALTRTQLTCLAGSYHTRAYIKP